MKWTTLAATALAALALGGCAHHYGAAGYRGHEMMGEQSVRFGVVDSVRDVRIALRESGAGVAGGSMLGFIGGSHIGRGSGQVAGAIGGALLGGLIGSQVERDANERQGVEVVVLLDSGKYIAVVQDAEEPLRRGDRVRVLSGRGLTRVTH